MKIMLRNALIAIIFLVAQAPFKSGAQNITGIWRGNFETSFGEIYKFEIQIELNAGNRVSGVSYSYLDTRFYGKATLTGSFSQSTSTALVQEIKTVEVKMSGGSTACIMKCYLNYSKSGREEFLEGTYSSMYETTDSSMGIIRGGNCGGGKVYLRKVATSDFYVEPFLRDKPEPQKQPEVKKPSNNTPARTNPNNTPARKPAEKKPEVTKQPEPTKDSIKRSEPIIVEKKTEKPSLDLPATTRARKNELVKTLIVNNPEITVRLYDNGEIDGDTISVYLDGKAVVSSKGLSTVPITVTLKLSEDESEHVLVMVAENMGSIPPNTSLMVVLDGDKRHEVSITSTEQKNAMVRFKYQKK